MKIVLIYIYLQNVPYMFQLFSEAIRFLDKNIYALGKIADIFSYKIVDYKKKKLRYKTGELVYRAQM